jgi:hypothetical protein
MHLWIEALTERMEAHVANGWKTSQIEESAIARSLKAIYRVRNVHRLVGREV